MRVLVVTRGHPFVREAFFAMFDAMPDIEWFHVEQPAALAVFEPEYAREFDAFVCYDMPGLSFSPGGVAFKEPPQRFKDNIEALTQQGKGFVFLHHAIAGWPAWPQYAEIIGGRFLYLPGILRDAACQDSGYRHSITHEIRVVQSHPVTAGLPASFTMTDELYLYEVFADSVTPLLTSNHAFVRDNFYSAAKAVSEGKLYDNTGWTHASGSNLVGWAKTYNASRIVYLQGGDDPVAYASPEYRQLIENAIRYVA